MALDWEKIKEYALGLPLSKRALLAEHLLASLDEADNDEIERLWVEEAERRYNEHKAGKLSGRPAEEALSDARANLR